MKPPIIIFCIALSIGVKAQGKKPTSDKIYFSRSNISDTSLRLSAPATQTWKYVYQGDYNTKYKPLDTVACLLHLHDKDNKSTLDGWQNGYAVLIDGGLETESIIWKLPFIPMAIGPFKNTFLGPDRKEVIKDDYVIQIFIKPIKK